MKLNKLLFVILFAISINCSSQTEKYLSETKTLSGYNYKELSNIADSEGKNLPLIIALHWMGSSPEDFSKYLVGFKKPVRVLLVEAPYPFEDGFSFYRTKPKSYYDLESDLKLVILIDEANKLSKFVKSANEKYKHPEKPVIIGASQGGDLSYMMAIKHGDIIGLACPLLATIESKLITQNVNKYTSPIVAFHGIEDPIVNIDIARNHIKQLSKNRYYARLKEYPNCGHGIPEEMQKDYIEVISSYFWALK